MSKTALQVIQKALRIIKVLDANQPLQSIDRNTALEALNDVIMHLPSQYNHLWTQTQGILLLSKGQQSYRLGAGGDRAVNADALVVSQSDASQLSGSNQIAVTDITGFANGMVIGMQMTDNTFHWTMITNIAVNVIDFADILPLGVNSGATVYAYSELIPRPQMIINAQFADRFNGSEISLEEWSRDDYFAQPDKSTQGSASQWYYSPQLNQGLLYLWPTAYSNLNVLNFTYIRPINVTANNADQVDFPAEWYLPLAYKVAEMLCDEYYVTPTEQQLIKMKSDELMGNVLAFDNSGDSIRIELFRWN